MKYSCPRPLAWNLCGLELGANGRSSRVLDRVDLRDVGHGPVEQSAELRAGETERLRLPSHRSVLRSGDVVHLTGRRAHLWRRGDNPRGADPNRSGRFGSSSRRRSGRFGSNRSRRRRRRSLHGFGSNDRDSRRAHRSGRFATRSSSRRRRRRCGRFGSNNSRRRCHRSPHGFGSNDGGSRRGHCGGRFGSNMNSSRGHRSGRFGSNNGRRRCGRGLHGFGSNGSGARGVGQQQEQVSP